MKPNADRIGWIALYTFAFAAALIGTMMFWFCTPLFVLAGLAVATGVPAPQAKYLALNVVLGSLVWIPVFLIFGDVTMP